MAAHRIVDVITTTKRFVFTEYGWSTDLKVFDRSGALLGGDGSVRLPSHLKVGLGFVIQRFPDGHDPKVPRPLVVVDPVVAIRHRS